MSKFYELPPEKLRARYAPEDFPFDDTNGLEPLSGIIGQERAVRAMEFGLRIKTRGYNLYMSGLTGTGKTSYAHSYLKKMAETMPVPWDWVYVHNFERANQPLAIRMTPGKAKEFQKDMEDFVKTIKTELSRAFDSEDYESGKSQLEKEFEERRDALMENLNVNAEQQGFRVKTTSAGIYFVPLVDGKAVSDTEYGELEEHVKKEINERSNILQAETLEVIRKIKAIEKEAEEKMAEWENRVALFAVGMHVNDLKDKYADHERVVTYLEKVQEDILSNIGDFVEEEPADDAQAMMLPFLRRNEENPTDKYRINVLVDNSQRQGAPVINDFNPTYYNLMGKLEYDSEFGNMTTDFTKIKSGLFHQANGGYLILQVKDLMSNAQSWEALKRVLRTRSVVIENIKEQMGVASVTGGLKPEPIPVDVKVVLVGSEYLYQMLYQYDEEFRKLFKIKVDFDEEMDRSEDNIRRIAQFISSFTVKEKTLPFDRTALARIIDYGSWLVEDQTKLSTRLNDLVEILCEANAWAEIDGAEKVTDAHVATAIREKSYRSNKYDQRLLELLKDGTLLVDTDGDVVGQINGLSILDMGDYTFGKPSRITAATFMGEKGIVNIEREIEMSGTSHTKGVLILSGYLGQKFSQDVPLSLTASLCFEQLYSGIDGDSASSTELYAILSSLADAPIRQTIAVTGSVNQKGEIQPIGGATAKIEGFFELCRSRGLDGRHGVIIPHQNVKNLALNDDVVEAVRSGMFHIWPVSCIEEGIEILTGLPAGKQLENGTWEEGSINARVDAKLRRYARTVASFGREEPEEVAEAEEPAAEPPLSPM